MIFLFAVETAPGKFDRNNVRTAQGL